MKVLVACEESQEVTAAFIALGHDVMSCDLYPGAKGLPHYQGDVMDIINEGWDLMIAHPPCTFISNAGAVHLFPRKVLSFPRYALGMDGKKFFMQNPTPSSIFNLPPHTQTIQPYQFGHPYKKRTLLWLKGLPDLIPTNDLGDGQSTKIPGNWYNKGGKERQKQRSRTFPERERIHYMTPGPDRQKMRSRTYPGIAKAFAEQWGGA